ncbi:hypothetical protein QR680_019110 [Steinernema hermaphroditum]|uniref:BTB domain-containing protein n=1 Tax=Steinernema hermaphroditum TaxID=289476 RepID=A0AA39LRC3_9BILA|nr:hypothetical protein QR680_019110 [Steinernema hermaphroditum]
MAVQGTFELVVDRKRFFDGKTLETDVQKIGGIKWKLTAACKNRNSYDIRLVCLPVAEKRPLLYSTFCYYSFVMEKATALVGIATDSVQSKGSADLTYFNALNFVQPTGNHGYVMKICLSVRFERLHVVDIAEPGEGTVPIVVDNVTFHLNRELLSFHSPFFKTFLNSTEFREGSTGQYNLKVDRQPLLYFLYFLYGFKTPSFEHIPDFLKQDTFALTEYFQCVAVLSGLEEKLLASPTEELKKWLDLADQYQLLSVVKKILLVMSVDEVKKATCAAPFMVAKYRPTTNELVIDRLAGHH